MRYGQTGFHDFRLRVSLIALCALAACGPGEEQGAANEPHETDASAPVVAIDPARITVSGISAGGMMAHQLHVAYSDLFGGAAAIAAGPYGCADGSLQTAMTRCMTNDAGGLPVGEFVDAMRADAAAGRIAPLGNLGDDRVWLFHGSRDEVVAAGVSDALAEVYAAFVPAENRRYVDDVPAAHHFPADGQGHPCGASESPFVGNCGYDAAGELLAFLYADLARPVEQAPDNLREVTLPGGAHDGLAGSAWLYVPEACGSGAGACALHLVLHGCAQSTGDVGTRFIEQSGYLPWAARNGIVLAFPQVERSATNPYACWDWWGYTGPDYRSRQGAQMRALAGWVAGLAGRPLT